MVASVSGLMPESSGSEEANSSPSCSCRRLSSPVKLVSADSSESLFSVPMKTPPIKK